MKPWILLMGFVVLFDVTGWAQEGDLEQFRAEVTVGGWQLKPSGYIVSDFLPVDLQDDLGIKDRKFTFMGKLVLKPGRKHRFVVEGNLFRLEGQNRLNRTITFAGKDYAVNETVSSDAKLDYALVGYQYDFISRSQGHLGFLVGAAMLDAKGTVKSPTIGQAEESITAPLPLLGMEFRVYPLAGRNYLNINTDIKGITAGDYGHFVHQTTNVGFSLGRHFTFQVGYSTFTLSANDTDNSMGFSLQNKGPVFSVQFRDR